MVGILSLQDLRQIDESTAAQLGALTIASDLCERRVVTIFEDEPLSLALARLDQHGFRQLPVVSRADPRRVVGMLERQHILAAYRRTLARRGEGGGTDEPASEGGTAA
jgi:CIC family chloride channel protein